MMQSLVNKSALAAITIGLSSLTISSAQAASFLPPSQNTCAITDITHPFPAPLDQTATDCAGQYAGNIGAPATANDFLQELNSNSLFGNISGWQFDRKVDIENSATEGANNLGLVLNVNSDQKSGTFQFTNINPAITNFVIALKGGNTYSTYFFAKGTYASDTVFRWTMDGLSNPGSQTPALSNFNVFYQVPTPALLPGLIGMGVAALRKKREDSEESDS